MNGTFTGQPYHEGQLLRVTGMLLLPVSRPSWWMVVTGIIVGWLVGHYGVME